MNKLKKQKILLGITSFIYILTVLGILLAVNFISTQYYSIFDVTSSKIFTLSDKSLNIIKNLDKDVSITMFYSRSNVLYDKLQNILKQYQLNSNKIKIEFLDPILDHSQTQILIQKHKLKTADKIILECGQKKEILSDNDLAEYSYNQNKKPVLRSFKGERAITSAILSVTEEKKQTIAFIEGHGEKRIDLETDQGLSKLKEQLEDDNYNITSIKLLGKEALTKDNVQVVAVIRPLLKFSDEELEVLQKYLHNGGNLLVFLDPLYQKGNDQFKLGIDDFLKNYGFNLNNTVVVDPPKIRANKGPAYLYIDIFSNHEITRNLENAEIVLNLARSVGIQSENIVNGYVLAGLARTTEKGWGEVNIYTPNFIYDSSTDIKGPVSIAACAKNNTTDSKIVVIGDSDFISNKEIEDVGHLTFALNSFNWLGSKKELITIPPRGIEYVHTALSYSQMRIIIWSIVIIFPVLIFIAGILVWWKRNRK
ncbi:MAG: GldG family protein [Candidatus Aureabacteria bacterium]|nr:GldG family protein [Candidatus Auribacterota bacterium]